MHPALETYPPTRADDLTETRFGVTLRDPYRWLEDAAAPAVRSWMEEQDRYARAWLARLPGRDALARRLGGLLYLDSIAPPLHRGNRYFYARTHADREKAIVYWKEGENGAERVLLDPNMMSADGTTALGVWVPSHDGERVVYALRENNADEATLHVMDVAAGRRSEIDVVPGAKYAEPSWTPAGDGFYYTYLPSDPAVPVAERPGTAEIRFHRLGTDPRTDRIVHARTGNPATFLRVDLSRDGHWLFATIQHGWNATEVFVADRRGRPAPGADPVGFSPLVTGRGALYFATAWQDRFYVHTNEGAPRYRVFRVDPARPARADWTEIVPEATDAVLEHLTIAGGQLVSILIRNAGHELEVRTLDGDFVRRVELPAPSTIGPLASNPDEDDVYVSTSSFTRPTAVHRTSIATGATTRWSAVHAPIDPKPYMVEQVWYPSRDGTRISMFVVRRRDMPRDATTPFILSGYGGFSVSRLPVFMPAIFAWLEAGGAYALPNLRGGGEYGEEWHRAGMLAAKQNVFDDFIAAAEHLIRMDYTRPGRLAISGGSNGGLLVGAALTQRPDLFRAVICSAPLLDMARYHLLGSGKTWTPEYGDPEREADFRVLAAYSPYHKVTAGSAYPALLMLSPANDDRVDPAHARKMVAALQAASASGHPVLLRIETHAGHAGADLVKKQIATIADTYAFLMHELAMPTRER